MLRNIRITAWIAIAVLSGTLIAAYFLQAPRAPTARDVAKAAISARFSLVDHTGRPVTEKDFQGRWLLVFFGFTFCPDVCPTTLGTVSAVLEQLGPLAPRVAPLFISIDPERDTPSALKSYVSAFSPRIIGLTGSPEQIKAATQSFRVYYARSARPAEADYTMDHSTILYLMNPVGQYDTHFPHQAGPGFIAETIRARIQAERAG